MMVKIRERMAVCNMVFVGWHNLEMFGVSPNDLYLHYNSVPVVRKCWEAKHMLYIPTPSIFAY